MLNANLVAQERNRRKAISTLRRLRRKARDEISRLIQFLDQSDPYVMTELEDDDEREDGGDAEPSLGSFDRITDQEKSNRQVSTWCLPPGSDLEHDDCDREPSLGSLDHNHSQERWAAGSRRDLEGDSAESGIGDHDGLLEQIGYRDWTQTVMA